MLAAGFRISLAVLQKRIILVCFWSPMLLITSVMTETLGFLVIKSGNQAFMWGDRIWATTDTLCNGVLFRRLEIQFL